MTRMLKSLCSRDPGSANCRTFLSLSIPVEIGRIPNAVERSAVIRDQRSKFVKIEVGHFDRMLAP